MVYPLVSRCCSREAQAQRERSGGGSLAAKGKSICVRYCRGEVFGTRVFCCRISSAEKLLGIARRRARRDSVWIFTRRN